MGRRETLKGLAIPDLTQPTIFVLITQDAFFALGMGCPSPDIAVKYPVSRHPVPDPRSRTLEEYEATGYRLLEDVLPPDPLHQLCAMQFEGEENWEDILLQGRNNNAKKDPCNCLRVCLHAWLALDRGCGFVFGCKGGGGGKSKHLPGFCVGKRGILCPQ